jgi:hypothetical protein
VNTIILINNPNFCLSRKQQQKQKQPVDEDMQYFLGVFVQFCSGSGSSNGILD